MIDKAGDVTHASGTPDKMTLYEQFESCMLQLENARTQFNFRRDVEWKFHLGLWALLLASLVAQKDLISAGEFPKIVLIIFSLISFALLIFYLLVWLVGTDVADLNDKNMMDHWREEAQRLWAIESGLASKTDAGGPQPVPPKIEMSGLVDRLRRLWRLATDPVEYVHGFYGWTTTILFALVLDFYTIKL